MNIVNLQKFDFNNSEGIDTLVLRYNSDEPGDSIVPETYIEVSGMAEGEQVSAVGYVLNNSTGITLKFADIANLGTVDAIEADGIYLILSSAMERVELTSNSNAHLVVKQVA